jgi:hemerythrin-like metal-binding protein
MKRKTPKKDSAKIKVSPSKPLLWSNKMSVEESKIDSQHKALVGAVNKISQKVKQGEEIKAIREALHFVDIYATEHFSYEEEYMSKIGFPDLRKHQEVHKKLVEDFIGFKNRFNKEVYLNKPSTVLNQKLADMILECRDYLKNWLKKHMMGEDQEYHKYAKKKHLIGKKFKDLEVKRGESSKLEVSRIAQSIREKLIASQRKPAEKVPNLKGKSKEEKGYLKTGITGFDELLDKGIPQGSSIIIAGGAGSGKTIFCLQTMINKAREGKKVLYMTLEESEEKLIHHMEDLGWNPKEQIKANHIKIMRMNPFDITRNVDALLAKQKGELLIDVDPVLFPKDCCKPDVIIIDSLTAIASAFTGREDSYRIYIEQLFRFLEKTGATSLLITETEQVPKIFSQTGVEEFLADGVIVLYSIKHGNIRENAIEILKLRGAGHQKKIVAMQVTESGILVYPEQDVFSDL